MPGRYEGNVDEELAGALDMVVCCGEVDAEFGSMDEGGHYALVVVTVEDNHDEGSALYGLKVGAFVVVTDEQGFVGYTRHPDEEAARRAFEALRTLREVCVP